MKIKLNLKCEPPSQKGISCGCGCRKRPEEETNRTHSHSQITSTMPNNSIAAICNALPFERIIGKSGSGFRQNTLFCTVLAHGAFKLRNRHRRPRETSLAERRVHSVGYAGVAEPGDGERHEVVEDADHRDLDDSSRRVDSSDHTPIRVGHRVVLNIAPDEHRDVGQ